MIQKERKGFTLVETILAGVILCGAVLALTAISTRSLSETKLNRQYERALAAADRQLTMIDYIGVEDFMESGQTEGKFEDSTQQYQWRAEIVSRDIDNLYMVKVEVSWDFRGQSYNVSIDTMLNSAAKLTGGII